MVTVGSLFDGIGGWLLAAVRAGAVPKWSSEIDLFPASVSHAHFPEVVQLGDVTKIKGNAIPPVDIICAGSPCQDLSIASECADGLAGTRSGLFREAIRIVREMQVKTNGAYPKFFIWENVTGAFSSNGRRDFQTVLEEISQTNIPMPRSGRWARAGLVRSPKCGAAWRVLDAQFWGVPQHRERIFLVAGFGDYAGSAQVLFEPESMPGDYSQGESQRKAAAKTVGRGAGTAGSVFENHRRDARYTECRKIAPTLTAYMGTGGGNVPLTFGLKSGRVYAQEPCWKTEKAFALAQKYHECMDGYAVRKLTPLECERLQGLPDNWTAYGNDSKRYKAIGNGMAQPCADYVMEQVVKAAEHQEERSHGK